MRLVFDFMPDRRIFQLGFRAEIPFEAGMRELLAWLEGQEAADSVDAAREALVARGLAR